MSLVRLLSLTPRLFSLIFLYELFSILLSFRILFSVEFYWTQYFIWTKTVCHFITSTHTTRKTKRISLFYIFFSPEFQFSGSYRIYWFSSSKCYSLSFCFVIATQTLFDTSVNVFFFLFHFQFYSFLIATYWLNSFLSISNCRGSSFLSKGNSNVALPMIPLNTIY